ncbi:unnamed protein product, partial [Rodentolepis nana]|uniref:Rab-GAP TBC domain-containing protein n=1 Tax=Rodentolepis nana TaxID=102285 RepID=A0A0R3TY05_RODNA
LLLYHYFIIRNVIRCWARSAFYSDKFGPKSDEEELENLVKWSSLDALFDIEACIKGRLNEYAIAYKD